LPLSLENENSSFHSCCSKIVCNGCRYANRKKGGGVYRCPFCRELAPSDEEVKNKTMERVKANDPAALCHMGLTCYNEGDNDTALKYLTKAAELEDIEAHYQLGVMYEYSRGVEEDMEKAVYHYEKAAIGGHPRARHNLGCLEEENGNADRAVKHFIIAANIGYPSSMKALWEHFKDGNITKKDLETTLRSHHDALNGMKSEQREAAEAQKKHLQS
jgi:TPR repeat protein